MSRIQIYIWQLRWECTSCTPVINNPIFIEEARISEIILWIYSSEPLAAAVRGTARILKFPGFWDISPGDWPNRINADFSHHSNQMLKGLHTVFFSNDLGKILLLKYRTTGRSSAEYYMLFASTTWSIWSAWKKYLRLRTQFIKNEPVFWIDYWGKSIPGIELEPSMESSRQRP
jgi:hypothetical protein